jgi:hypothetical protein
MRCCWRVEVEAGEERVEAGEVEITASGTLVFYRFASRREQGRTSMTAFSPHPWRRCHLEGETGTSPGGM